QRIRTTIRAIENLSHNVVGVTLSYTGRFDFRPGQFVNVTRSDGLARSYSLANTFDDTAAGDLRLHVRKMPDGKMSEWFHQQALVGDTIEVSGPLGDCFYLPGEPEQ